MNPIKVAIVGCGHIAGAYVRSIQQSPYSQIVAVCDNRIEHAADFATKNGIRGIYGDFAQMLRDEAIDLLVNITPPYLHGELNRQALKAGVNVWSEKPIATEMSVAQELLALAKEHGLGIWSAPITPLSPSFQYMAERIADGSLGIVNAAHGISGHSVPLWDAWFYREGGGTLFDIGVYTITTLTGLLGPAKSVTAMAGIVISERLVKGEKVMAEVEDNAALVLDHGNACYSVIQCGFTYRAQQDDWTIQVIGTEGSMAMEGYDWEPKGVRVFTSKESAWTRQATDQGDYEMVGGAVYIIDCLANGKEPILHADHPVHVLEIMLAAKESARTGARIAIHSSFSWPLISTTE
ncbi:Gfo/Idh/MocA family protein [Paenibacillus lignilyticus]|uniref:Gfo/Idh/MocA family oxidoreductase n=1 Tax=Paenibacillus lignilyticus TaxID=1172615 RepID=A0ABS5C9K0_9BACL|nr:Gfo/Idh/MocA family oxidoreductase [Paenibacillus lignilyticus]MBP3962672.1 Gfo/Idh/MocA family oxidoreductase [Paenibacillus lignilyticus]